ncbi:hypothetical protein HX864_03485 [Pseudomonas yamanorum]|jgi:hypothetical protein|uniref:hypothetical protein n=1 Tax=Pseudomonas yamanorum TaxID=515393 RepID=UPI0015A06709|nr:hypothetical protein [Pseudomonas yamanorum]NWD22315.1 hypothetical protein [Pseudomonas yamanorum]
MTSEGGSLLLRHHVRKRGVGSLLCRETRLHLSSDQGRLVLSRYVEHYSPHGVRWVERQHSVALADVMRWLITQGETSDAAWEPHQAAGRTTS